MDSQSHHDSRSRLKIRRAPSCKISASFHGSCSQKKKAACNNTVIQPLIIHTVDPEITKAEPAEFMWVVQSLTGSPDTRRLACAHMQISKQMQSSLQVQDVQLMQESNDEGGTTPIIAPSSFISPNLSINDLPPTPSSPNASDKHINHPSKLPLSSPANQLDPAPSPLSPAAQDLSNNTCSHPLITSHTNQLNLKTNHPSAVPSKENTNHSFSPISSSSCAMVNSKELPFSPTITPISLPFSAKSSNCGSTPVSAKASDEFNNTRGSPCSPNSSLTTSSESEAEEDSFFVFSLDSYYGNVFNSSYQ